jgi:hypothetical protein
MQITTQTLQFFRLLLKNNAEINILINSLISW